MAKTLGKQDIQGISCRKNTAWARRKASRRFSRTCFLCLRCAKIRGEITSSNTPRPQQGRIYPPRQNSVPASSSDPLELVLYSCLHGDPGFVEEPAGVWIDATKEFWSKDAYKKAFRRKKPAEWDY